MQRKMVKIIHCSNRTKDWPDEQCRRTMFNRTYDLIFKYCSCVCGGTLNKDENDPNLKEPDKEQKKKKVKQNKNLPGLVLDASTGTVANVHKKAGKFKTSTFATYGRNTDYAASSLDEKPNMLPVGMHRPVDISIKVPKTKSKNISESLKSVAKTESLNVQKSQNREPVNAEPMRNHCEFQIPDVVLQLANIEMYWCRIVDSMH